MYYPQELIEEVRQRNDIVDVISGYVSLKRQGGNYFGLCPFHSEKSPSFSVSPHKQMYYCFGCHKGGSVINFIMEYENFSFPEALRLLADRVNVKLPEIEYTEEMKKKESRRLKLMEINEEAAKYYYLALRSEQGKLGMRYLEGRQLNGETMKKFWLGYSLQYKNSLINYLKSKGYDSGLIRDTGLVDYNEKYGMSDKFFNRVMFPIMDINHKVIAFGGRVMGDGQPKYLNSRETEIFDKSRNLYGLNFARSYRKDWLILCEGYMDVIALHQAGFTQAVASLGTSFTSGQATLLKRFKKNAYLAYDSDGAGVDAALRAISILRDASLECRVINMQPYKDPDEFIKNLGAEEFEKRMEEAENSFLFEIRILKNQFHMDDPGDKTRFYNEIAKKLCRFEEEMERENYLTAVAQSYQINPQSLRKQVVNLAAAGIGYKPVEVRSGIRTQKNTVEEGQKKVQRTLLTWLAEEPKLYDKIKSYITPEDFTDELYQRIAGQMFEMHDKGEDNPAAIIEVIEDQEERSKVAEIFHTPLEHIETKEEWECAIKDIVLNVKRNSLAYFSAKMGKDVNALQQVISAKKALEELEKMHFTLE